VDTPVSIPRFYLDQPADWKRLPRCVIIRGWCFGADGKSIRAIRLLANNVMLAGVTGLPRPDVRAAMPEAPDDNTGFEIRGTLPSGRITISLEAASTDGVWQLLMSCTADVERQIVPLWLGGGAWTELMFFGKISRVPAVGAPAEIFHCYALVSAGPLPR